MIDQLHRSSSWTGRGLVLAIALLGSQLHQTGTPERALAEGGAVLVMGSVMGIAMVAIVVARLLGRSIALIHTDGAAMLALLFMIAVKVTIARMF